MMPLEVHPARAASARDLPALETALAALALDERSPIALELAATATTRHFLLRAEQPIALRYLEKQIQARYPQARISLAVTDPLERDPEEECAVWELRPGAAAYLPLRSWKTRDLLAEGTDPLLGILGAFGTLPEGVRAVVQLALVPASPTWSAGSRRYAVEHPLAKERIQTRGAAPQHTIKDVLLLLPVVVASLLLYLFHRLIPSWLLQAAGQLLQGQIPHLTAAETFVVVVGALLLLVFVFGSAYGLLLLASRFGSTAIYDQRLAEEKTARPAYRVRLHLFVFTPGERSVVADPSSSRPALNIAAVLVRWRSRARVLFHWLGSTLRSQDGRRQARVEVRQAWQQQRSLWHSWLEWARRARARRRARNEILRMLAASYRQYHLASGGYFVPHPLSQRRAARLLAVPARRWFGRVGWASDVAHSTHYLSVADLAALWHLPQAQDLADLAYVDQQVMRTLLAPTVLSTIAGYQLGVSNHAGQTRPVFLPFGCLGQNILAAASTGKGKSSLFYHLIRAYAMARVLGRTDSPNGALLIDPHGDLVSQVAGSLPPELADAIVVIDLADRTFPIGFNPLDMSGQSKNRDKVIDHLIVVVEALWPTSYGPRTESFLEYSCKTLAEANIALITADPLHGPNRQYTLLDVIPLLRQTSFRNKVLEQVRDPYLKSWWKQYYELLDARQQSDFTSSLITKIAKFSSTELIRTMVGQPRSSVDLGELIQQDKIVLFSCASGEVGADMAALFGSLFIGFFQAALQEQAQLNPAERHRFLVLIDEFQALAGVNYQVMLAELRKYGGSFALATQSMAYLDRFEKTLRATVLANAEHIFAFAMADEDARLLRLPGIEPDDVTQLSSYACYVRLTLAGERLPVFSLHLAAPEAGDVELRQSIAERCRMRYGRAAGEVEQILRECQARRDEGLPPDFWSIIGVNSVEEAREQGRNKRRRGGTKRDKDENPTADGSVAPEHLIYEERDDDLPPGGPGGPEEGN